MNESSVLSCFNCGYAFTGNHVCMTDEKAEFRDGDISICFNCGEVHQYKNGGLELIDIRVLPKKTQEEILRINVARETVMQRNRVKEQKK